MLKTRDWSPHTNVNPPLHQWHKQKLFCQIIFISVWQQRPMCCWISVCTVNSTSKTVRPPQSNLLYCHHPSSIYDSFRMGLLAQTSVNPFKFPPDCSETCWFVFWGHCHTLKAPLHQIQYLAVKALARAVYFLESAVAQPLTLGLTHLDASTKDHGSERKRRWTTRYSLRTTFIWSQIRRPTVSHWWCCLKVDVFTSLSNQKWSFGKVL